jgi:hypothetical protein
MRCDPGLPYEKSASAAGIRRNRGRDGRGFPFETDLSGDSHDADKDLSLSIKRVS